jgi:hypothetical protein
MSDNKAQDQAAAENSRGLFEHGSDQHRMFSSTAGALFQLSLSGHSNSSVEDMQKHQCHHYMSTYGGMVVRSMAMGFGATLGADAANAIVGDIRKEWWK